MYDGTKGGGGSFFLKNWKSKIVGEGRVFVKKNNMGPLKGEGCRYA